MYFEQISWAKQHVRRKNCEFLASVSLDTVDIYEIFSSGTYQPWFSVRLLTISAQTEPATGWNLEVRQVYVDRVETGRPNWPIETLMFRHALSWWMLTAASGTRCSLVPGRRTPALHAPAWWEVYASSGVLEDSGKSSATHSRCFEVSRQGTAQTLHTSLTSRTTLASSPACCAAHQHIPSCWQ